MLAVAVVAGAAVAAVVWVPKAGAAGVVEGLLEAVEDAACPNKPPVGAGGAGAGAEVDAVPGVVEGAELPAPPNRPPAAGAAAGVVEGAAVDVAPPKEGNKDF